MYALKDILEAKGIKRSLSEISVMTLSVDIMADIIKVGEPKLKTTLFAINKTAKALGLDYQSLKVAPQDEFKLKVPFIAHFKNEHFVTVQKIAGGEVYYTDLDYPRIVAQKDFLKNADGYVFAQAPSFINYKLVPEALQAFVWGDKWRDLSKNVPGLVTGSQLTMMIIIWVCSIVLSCLGALMQGASQGAQAGTQAAQAGGQVAAQTGAAISQAAVQAIATSVSQAVSSVLGSVVGAIVTFVVMAVVKALVAMINMVWAIVQTIVNCVTSVVTDIGNGDIGDIFTDVGNDVSSGFGAAMKAFGSMSPMMAHGWVLAMDFTDFTLQLGQLTQTLETMYVLKHPGSEDEAFILGTAIDAAVDAAVAAVGTSIANAPVGTTSGQAFDNAFSFSNAATSNVYESFAVGFALAF